MAPKTFLGKRGNFLLMRYIEEKYAESGLTDQDFATKAAEVLGLPVNRDHVNSSRAALEIPANVSPGQASRQSLTDIKVKELEDLVLAQSVRLDDCVRKIETLQRDLHLHPPGVRK